MSDKAKARTEARAALKVFLAAGGAEGDLAGLVVEAQRAAVEARETAKAQALAARPGRSNEEWEKYKKYLLDRSSHGAVVTPLREALLALREDDQERFRFALDQILKVLMSEHRGLSDAVMNPNPLPNVTEEMFRGVHR